MLTGIVQYMAFHWPEFTLACFKLHLSRVSLVEINKVLGIQCDIQYVATLWIPG